MQTYLTKITAGNPILQSDAINPLIYFQLINANAWFMQQLSALQTFNCLTDPSTDATIHTGRKSQSLPGDSSIYVPKTRPMTQEEIAEHARLVYQRALQRNQIQQHHDLMKHFYETLNLKQQVSSNATYESLPSTDQNDVPTVPNVSNIGKKINSERLRMMLFFFGLKHRLERLMFWIRWLHQSRQVCR